MGAGRTPAIPRETQTEHKKRPENGSGRKVDGQIRGGSTDVNAALALPAAPNSATIRLIWNRPSQSPSEIILMSLLFRRASLASLGLAVGLSALSLSPLMAQEAAPAAGRAAAAPAPAAGRSERRGRDGQRPADDRGRPWACRGRVSTSSSPSCRPNSAAPRHFRRSSKSGCHGRRGGRQRASTRIPTSSAAWRSCSSARCTARWSRRSVVDKITDAEIRARYDKEIANTPPVNEVHARHILVKTKEEAEAIIKQLDGGADFQKLANEHTSDPGSGKTSGGDLG